VSGNPEYRCKGCHEEGTIVSVSAVPRHQDASPAGFTHDAGIDWTTGNDEAYWEAEHDFGFGCSNDSCPYVAYQFGIIGGEFEVDGKKYLKFANGLDIEDIADVIDLDAIEDNE
jgi:hypothetical protein